jgi:tetratricopeptide (TPR) repeat protein
MQAPEQRDRKKTRHSTMEAKLAALKNDGYFDLGTYHRPITTKSPDAQRWFNRGLIWSYGFNTQEAFNCFERVILADPSCAMGYWGLAYTRGPYYNKAWRLFDPEDLKISLDSTYNASRQALDLVESASPVEQALIHALVARYPQSTPTDDFSVWDRAYADAMEVVYNQFSDDLDVVTLYTDALMNLTPWAMWDPYSGKPGPKARTLETEAVVSRALKQSGASEHPGLLHLHIHLMEMSRTPEAAVPSADLLRGLVPNSGHLNHMPSHLDVLIGDYRNAVAANTAAVKADQKYVEKVGGMNMYAFYRAHDYHSLIYAAMLSGQSQIALENCTYLEDTLPVELLTIKSPPMADWLEAFCAVRPHVLIRFGRWDDIIDLALPTNQSLHCVTTATIHYAKGVAFAATGNVYEALKQQTLFYEAVARVPSSRMDYPNKCVNILKVAEAMLAGEIEYRRRNYEVAFEHLRRSIDLDDHLIYSEPWGWMQPARHAYAALLLEQGRVEEAATAYAEDLGLDESFPRGHQHPNNVWALHGYHECLTLLGRTAEAKMLELPLKLATCLAYITIQSSCFCRTTNQEDSQNAMTACNNGGGCSS